MALGIIDNIQELGITKPVLDMDHNSPEYLHLLVESLRWSFSLFCNESNLNLIITRLAFADSQYYVTDPEFAHIPVKELLSKVRPAVRHPLFCWSYEHALLRNTSLHGLNYSNPTRRIPKLFTLVYYLIQLFFSDTLLIFRVILKIRPTLCISPVRSFPLLLRVVAEV